MGPHTIGHQDIDPFISENVVEPLAAERQNLLDIQGLLNPAVYLMNTLDIGA
jgi:hypothetical protein